ncbi:ParB/RepB/Spo0J family partition protein [Pseudomonas sp. NPDC098747]|uniref:ParB/RepB/Spo0J family partition protein n=1 Tax=Pseudomonas sp. NPDC098747 TaxID=3364487 RepID=UPI00383A83D0
MKSNDYPGNPNSQTMHGLRTPEAIPKPQVSRATARALMLEKAGLNAAPEVNQTLSAALLEGELIDGERILANVPVNQIVKSPYQPRLVFDEKAIEELATSIQTIGLGKPIIVRRLPDGKLELVGGERRWRAVRLNGDETIPAVIQNMTDGIAMILALTDNGGEDLTDYEHARSYHRILENGEEQSQRALARRLGVNVSIVSRCLTLMQLPESIRAVLDKSPGLITCNYAKRFVDHVEAQPGIVAKAVQAMDEAGVQQEAALRLIEKEIAALNKDPTPPKNERRSIEGVGTIKVTGTRLEFKCEKGIDPQRLSQHFEEFLRTLDLSAVRSEVP